MHTSPGELNDPTNDPRYYWQNIPYMEHFDHVMALVTLPENLAPFAAVVKETLQRKAIGIEMMGRWMWREWVVKEVEDFGKMLEDCTPWTESQLAVFLWTIIGTPAEWMPVLMLELPARWADMEAIPLIREKPEGLVIVCPRTEPEPVQGPVLCLPKPVAKPPAPPSLHALKAEAIRLLESVEELPKARQRRPLEQVIELLKGL